MANQPTLDQEVIDSLLEIDDGLGKFLLELITIYEANSPAKFQQMEAHLDKMEWKNLAEIAHQIKSSSGNLGMREVQRICEEIESEAEIGNRNNSLLEKVTAAKKKFSESMAALADVKRSIKS